MQSNVVDIAGIKIVLEERTCECGCGMKFSVMPISKQVMTVTCQKRIDDGIPAPHETKPAKPEPSGPKCKTTTYKPMHGGDLTEIELNTLGPSNDPDFKPTKKGPKPKADYFEMIHDWQESMMSATEIAEKYCVTKSTVYLKCRGIPRNMARNVQGRQPAETRNTLHKHTTETPTVATDPLAYFEPKRERNLKSRPLGRASDYDKEWNRCTARARELHLSINRSRVELAELALSICQVDHGGGGHWSEYKGIRTLADFSRETGIAYKTLHHYVRIKRDVIDKLPPGTYDERDYGAARRTLNETKGKKSTPKEVAEVYDREKKRCGSDHHAGLCLKWMKYIRNYIRKRMSLKHCDRKELIGIRDMARETEIKLTEYLGDGKTTEGQTTTTTCSAGKESRPSEDRVVRDDLQVSGGSAKIGTGKGDSRNRDNVRPRPSIATLGKGCKVDLNELMKTRMLIQANSGGGKSWTIRKLAEQLQESGTKFLVLDPEGEFVNLCRSKTTLYVEGQDISDTTQSAIDFLKGDQSMVVDLFEMGFEFRKHFVRDFFNTMINAKRELWQDVVVILDEAHMFAPQRGKEKTGCREAVASIATRGRKRGYCLIAATQRLSKFNKDVAAELLNKLIGRTNLDIDVNRAADELEINKKEAWALRDLEPGEFYAFGPAISDVPIPVTIGATETQHG